MLMQHAPLLNFHIHNTYPLPYNLIESSDANGPPGSPVAWLRHLSRSKWRGVALGDPGSAQPVEFAQSCKLTILVAFIPQLCLLSIKYIV